MLHLLPLPARQEVEGGGERVKIPSDIFSYAVLRFLASNIAFVSALRAFWYSLSMVYPNVAKAGGLQSQDVKGEAVIYYRNPLTTPDLMSSGFQRCFQ
ncbi:MAG: hypothetical protein WCB15_12315, partial [Desulfobacterales bacterium]